MRFIFFGVMIFFFVNLAVAKATPTSPVVQSTGDALRSLAVVMTLTGVEVARRKRNLVLRKGIEPAEKLTTEAGRAALHVLNEPSVWFAFTAHVASSLGGGEPAVRILGRMLGVTPGQRIIRRFLQASIATAIGMSGWEFGQELWIEARNRLTSQAEYIESGEVSVLMKSYFETHDKQSQTTINDLFDNIADILVRDPGLRDELFSTLWKTKIFKGSYFSRMLFTSGGSVIGELLLPAQPSFGAFIIGVGSGVLQNYLDFGSIFEPAEP